MIELFFIITTSLDGFTSVPPPENYGAPNVGQSSAALGLEQSGKLMHAYNSLDVALTDTRP
jgi:hypothetical protein